MNLKLFVMTGLIFKKCPLCDSENIELVLETKDFSVSQESFEVFECKNCDFGFTQNQPIQDEIGKYYQFEDYISHTDTNKGLVNKLYHFARNFMLNKKYRLIKRYKKPGSLLDIGSGTGYFLNYMKNKSWEVKGVEQEESARFYSEEKFGLKVFPAEKIYFLSEHQFDLITMWHVLEHVHDLNGYMNIIQNNLKDDGCLILALPNKNSFDAKFYKKYWAAYDVPRHIWHFSPKSVKQTAEKYGMKVHKIKAMPLDGIYVSLLSEKHKKNKLALVSGFILGGLFWFLAVLFKKRSSSIIYVLKKAA